MRRHTPATTGRANARASSDARQHTRSVTNVREQMSDVRGNMPPISTPPSNIVTDPLQHPTTTARFSPREGPAASPAAKTLFTCPRTRCQRTDVRCQTPFSNISLK
jgi:hypothetical protein